MRTSLAATTRRFLRWEFIPEAVLFIGLTAFFVHQNDAATSAFKSTKALAIMAAVTLGWLGARALFARLVPFAVARAAVFSVAAAVALSVVVLPAYDNETVIESFPTAAPAPAPPAAPASPSAAAAAPMPTPPVELAAPMPAPAAAAQKKPAPAPTTSTTATAPAPVADGTAIPPSTTAPTQPEVAASATAEPAPPPAQSGPQRLRAGALRGIDHRASGTAVIYRQPDGRYVVGLEDIDIQPGPDYDLYIVPGSDRRDTKNGIRLGDLRGNRGTQFYDVPAGVNLEDGPWTVLVWCQTFAVPVANATPS